MKTQKSLFFLLSIALTTVITACDVKVDSPAHSPIPAPQPKPFPTSCVNYNGKYQVNADLIQITQKNCEEVVFTQLPTYWNPETVTKKYIPDGLDHNVGDVVAKAEFQLEHLWITVNYPDRRTLTTRYSFQQKPCNLMNPSGELFLTSETWVNGVYSQDKCKFWSKTN